ncbi:hypothetical protein C8A03DRAFT_17968, partial [Achaetomium macrosporum]
YSGQLAALIEAQSTIRNPLMAPRNLLLLGKQIDTIIPVDNLKHVGRDFARYYIQASRSLRIFSLVEDPAFRSPASTEFPSWLPDLTAPLRPLPLDTEHWGTAQAHFPRRPPKVEGDSLLVQGNKLTTIILTTILLSTL